MLSSNAKSVKIAVKIW